MEWSHKRCIRLVFSANSWLNFGSTQSSVNGQYLNKVPSFQRLGEQRAFGEEVTKCVNSAHPEFSKSNKSVPKQQNGTEEIPNSACVSMKLDNTRPVNECRGTLIVVLSIWLKLLSNKPGTCPQIKAPTTTINPAGAWKKRYSNYIETK